MPFAERPDRIRIAPNLVGRRAHQMSAITPHSTPAPYSPPSPNCRLRQRRDLGHSNLGMIAVAVNTIRNNRSSCAIIAMRDVGLA